MDKVLSHLVCPSCKQLLLDPVSDVDSGVIYNRSCFIKLLKARAVATKTKFTEPYDVCQPTHSMYIPVPTVRNIVLDMIKHSDLLTTNAKATPVNLIVESKIPSDMLQYFSVPDNFYQLVINYNSKRIFNALKSGAYMEEFLLNSFTEDVIKGIDFTFIDMKTMSSILIVACRSSYSDIALTIIKHLQTNFAPDVALRILNHFNNNKDTALTVSARRGLTDVVSALMKVNGVDINHVNRFGRSAIFYLAGNSIEENLATAVSCEKTTLHLLNEYSMDYNQCDITGTSVLMHACRNISLKVVQKLLEKKDININHQNDEGENALMCLCDLDAQMIHHKLLEFDGFPVSEPSSDTFDTSLTHSNIVKTALRIEKEVSDLILDVLAIQGIDVKCTDKQGYDALLCSSENFESVALKLIDLGAPVDRVYDEKRTVLLTACETGNVNLITKLLSLNKNVLINQCDSDGVDALIELCRSISSRKNKISHLVEQKTNSSLKEYIKTLFEECESIMKTIVMLANHPDFVLNKNSVSIIKSHCDLEVDSNINFEKIMDVLRSKREIPKATEIVEAGAVTE